MPRFLTRSRVVSLVLLLSFSGSTLSVKYVPSWFPWAGKIRTARQGCRLAHDSCYGSYKMTKEKVVSNALRNTPARGLHLLPLFKINGTAKQCMISDLIQENLEMNGDLLDEDAIAGSAGSVYLGNDFLRDFCWWEGLILFFRGCRDCTNAFDA